MTEEEKLSIIKRLEKLESAVKILNFKINEIDKSHAVFGMQTEFGMQVKPYIDKYKCE